MSSQSTISGAAGEHYVMLELLRRGYIAALASQGVPTIDIIVTDQRGAHLASIQVKSRRDMNANGGWQMNAKHEKFEKNLFYCLVDFGKLPEDHPTVHVVPSEVVVVALIASHQKWLSTPGKGGKAHNDFPMPKLQPDCSHLWKGTENQYPAGWLRKYLGAWRSLGLDPAVATEIAEA